MPENEIDLSLLQVVDDFELIIYIIVIIIIKQGFYIHCHYLTTLSAGTS